MAPSGILSQAALKDLIFSTALMDLLVESAMGLPFLGRAGIVNYVESAYTFR